MRNGMKKGVAALAAAFMLAVPAAEACTRLVYHGHDGAVITARSMDWKDEIMTNLWIFPRGMARDGSGGPNSLTWTSKYGSVIASGYDISTVDGVNEMGLVANVLWLVESQYPAHDPNKPALSIAAWAQYALDNYATVAEAVEGLRDEPFVLVSDNVPGQERLTTLHLSLSDSGGDSAIFEYIDGKLVIHHSRDYQVMTNSPTYDQQLELVKEIDGLGGEKPLPGSTLASDRFARASFYVKHQVQPKTQLQGMAAMFSIIRNAAQPFRTPEPGKPAASQTIWQVVADLTNKRYAFASTTRPNIVWVDFDKLSFNEGTKELKLDLLSRLALEGGIAGDVSHQFKSVDDLTKRILAAGVEGLELIAAKQDEFKAIEQDVERRVNELKHSVAK